MTFGSTFGRVFSPTFQPKSQAASGGWWDLDGTITSCVAAYQPKGAASLAASYVNLANPGTYNAYAGSAPDWGASDGWIFRPNNLYTGINPSNNQDWSMLIRYSDLTDGTQEWLSGSSGSGGTPMFGICGSYEQFGNYKIAFANGGQKVGGTRAASGVLCVAGSVGYLDGSSIVTGIPTKSDDDTIANLVIGGYNDNGYINSSQRAICHIQAFAIYNATLTSTQIGNLTTATNAL